jgi:hypothetical protein
MTDIHDLPAPPNPSKARFMWFRRRFLKLPVWAWILIVLIVGGFSSGSSSKNESTRSATEESTPVQETSSSVTETPATDAPTTTERVTTTTENLADQRDLEVLLTAGMLREGEERLNLVNAIEDDFILERVDIFTVDFVDGDSTAFIFRVEGASGYSTDEIQIESMWDLVSLLSTMWEPDGILRNDVGTLKPSLTVVVDGRGYIAPYELMVRLAERNVTQTEWIELAER